jgi:hypothetical protein
MPILLWTTQLSLLVPLVALLGMREPTKWTGKPIEVDTPLL